MLCFLRCIITPNCYRFIYNNNSSSVIARTHLFRGVKTKTPYSFPLKSEPRACCCCRHKYFIIKKTQLLTLCCNNNSNINNINSKSLHTSSTTSANTDRSYNSNISKTNPMDVISVIDTKEDDKLRITLDYGHNAFSSRNFNLVRSKDEPLGQCLSRLKANISKYICKNVKKRKRKLKKNINEVSQEESPGEDEEEDVEISLWKDNVQISESASNIESWVTGSSLKINSSLYKVIVNIPAITKFLIPTNIMVGFPVYLQIEYLFTDVTQCHFCWYKDIKEKDSSSSDNSDQHQKENCDLAHDGQGQATSTAWELLSPNHDCHAVYTPSIEDLGHKLKVVALPQDNVRNIVGKEVVAESSVCVETGPGFCPFQTRHLFTKNLTENECVRMVSYNLLADLYADSDYSRTVLYSYCPSYALSIDYRKQLILKEIAGYNADLICLQEVDKKIFENDLNPALSLLGFDGLLRTKAGQVAEGCATFFRKTKFKLLSQHDIIIMEVIQNDPRFKDILELLESNEGLQQRILNRQTVLQLTVLESLERPGNLLCAANIHLYFHPTAKSIRLLQTAVSIRQIDSVLKHYQDQGKKITLTFCGDFNSSPEFGVHQFLTTGFIPADFEEWKAEGNPDGVDVGISLSHSLNLSNGCGSPEYTNYVGGFHAHLDYIYHDPERLEVLEVVPPPEHEEVVLHTALPSLVFPSDHIAQICTLRWR